VLLILVLISRPLAMLYPLVMLADGKRASASMPHSDSPYR
jgi:hypothetical protein